MFSGEGGGGGREIQGMNSGSNDFQSRRLVEGNEVVWSSSELTGVRCGQIRTLARHRPHSALSAQIISSLEVPSFGISVWHLPCFYFEDVEALDDG